MQGLTSKVMRIVAIILLATKVAAIALPPTDPSIRTPSDDTLQGPSLTPGLTTDTLPDLNSTLAPTPPPNWTDDLSRREMQVPCRGDPRYCPDPPPSIALDPPNNPAKFECSVKSVMVENKVEISGSHFNMTMLGPRGTKLCHLIEKDCGIVYKWWWHRYDPHRPEHGHKGFEWHISAHIQSSYKGCVERSFMRVGAPNKRWRWNMDHRKGKWWSGMCKGL